MKTKSLGPVIFSFQPLRTSNYPTFSSFVSEAVALLTFNFRLLRTFNTATMRKKYWRNPQNQLNIGAAVFQARVKRGTLNVSRKTANWHGRRANHDCVSPRRGAWHRAPALLRTSDRRKRPRGFLRSSFRVLIVSRSSLLSDYSPLPPKYSAIILRLRLKQEFHASSRPFLFNFYFSSLTFGWIYLLDKLICVRDGDLRGHPRVWNERASLKKYLGKGRGGERERERVSWSRRFLFLSLCSSVFQMAPTNKLENVSPLVWYKFTRDT